MFCALASCACTRSKRSDDKRRRKLAMPPSPTARQFEIFAAARLRERTTSWANDQLADDPAPKASRQRQQQLLPPAKIPAGVDVSDLENGGSLWLC